MSDGPVTTPNERLVAIRTRTVSMTPARLTVLDALVLRWQRDGRPPTIRHLCADTGYKSSSTIWAHVEALRILGYVHRDNRQMLLPTTEGVRRVLGDTCPTCRRAWPPEDAP